MFYGSEKLETAMKEVILSGEGKSKDNKIIIWGKFQLLKDVYVVDLHKKHAVCIF